jgi:uncharacterized protein YciI
VNVRFRIICNGLSMPGYDHERNPIPMPLFAAIVTFTDDVERRLRVRPTHREYLKSLLEAGKLHESGPFGDDSGALLIYDAADIAEVQELMGADPYTPAGIIEQVSIHEWNRVIARPSAHGT